METETIFFLLYNKGAVCERGREVSGFGKDGFVICQHFSGGFKKKFPPTNFDSLNLESTIFWRNEYYLVKKKKEFFFPNYYYFTQRRGKVTHIGGSPQRWKYVGRRIDEIGLLLIII
jgi:hypothetical protein